MIRRADARLIYLPPKPVIMLPKNISEIGKISLKISKLKYGTSIFFASIKILNIRVVIKN